MAEQRTPGTLDGSRGNRDVRDGTLQLRPGMTPGVIGGPVPGNTGLWDTLIKGAERIDAVSDAIQVGRQRAGAAILKETGHALEEVVKGLIPGLLLMLVTVVATTVIGGAIGAAVGFLAGGVGAAPGAVVGADLGFSIGMSILTWMGLAFLAEGIAKGFGEMVGAISVGTTLAWDSPDSPNPRAEIDKAGAEYAHAIALLFKFILMAIVLRLAGPASEALIAQLRKSRLGEGFASWVVRNKEALLKNPKLQAPRPKAVQSEKPVETAVTPSQVKQGGARRSESNQTQTTKSAVADKTKAGKFIFRGDSRPPEVVFSEGLQPRGANEDLYRYALQNEPSVFVPTSKSPTVAREFAEMQGGGYVYTIRGQPGGIDVNEALGARSPFPHELEIAVPGGVKPSDILGARQVSADGKFIGPFLKNGEWIW